MNWSCMDCDFTTSNGHLAYEHDLNHELVVHFDAEE